MHPTTLLPLLAALALAQQEPCAFSRRVLTQCGSGPLFNIDPDTGAICDPLDCGGGRAPPKTTVPGCPQYSGTLPSTTRFLECWTPTSAVVNTAVTTSSGSVGTTTEGVVVGTTEGGVVVQTTVPTTGGATGVTRTTATSTAATNGVEAQGVRRGVAGVMAVVVGVVQVVMV